MINDKQWECYFYPWNECGMCLFESYECHGCMK